MTKHRRTRHYRKIAIGALAVSALAVPTAAMACLNGPGEGHWGHGKWHGNAHRHHHWASAGSQAKPSTGTTQKPAATPSPTASGAPASGTAASILKLVNSERSKAGCSPLKLNAKLTKAAQDHSKDMAAHRNMSHTGSDGSDPGQRITRAGYRWSAYGENVAYGYSSPASVMKGWMNSPGHKRNILDCSFKELGVGLAQPGDYWTQDFGTAG
ncbi:CAP domain-containing protein [Streptomyces endophytica]|uniref:CAP domain-containing protein n=1 Tax=Streptomyces endophytica TaxID=2991496 RepID=A0ABY6PG28_9ACTN|nr:CAP domain-containing protein [Streptomyces endophytica]UZJ32835.1 CAP domain-containing protein [Streptomyces endophytica]